MLGLCSSCWNHRGLSDRLVTWPLLPDLKPLSLLPSYSPPSVTPPHLEFFTVANMTQLSGGILFLFSFLGCPPDSWASLVAQMVKNPPAMRVDPGLIPGLGRFCWRRAWQPTPVFLPGESLWSEEPGGLWSTGCKESDMTE